MSSSRKALRTLASRLTLWNAAIYIAFFGTAFLVFYFSISAAMHADLNEDLEEDIDEFRVLLREDGFAGVRTEIEREIYADGQEDSFFRVLHPDGHVLFASDLSPWKGLEQRAVPQSVLNGTGDTVFETLDAPDDDYTARAVYGWIGTDMILHTGESMEDMQDFLALLVGVFSGAFILVVLFASVTGWLMARRAMRGVEAVSKTAVDVANGTLDKRVDVDAEGAEIARLASTFNAMLDRIHTLVSGMRDMTDNVAHDLRSPLARIRANTEMALTGAKTVEEFEASAADSLEECDRLMHMINTTLDVAEAEAGVARLALEPVDMSKVAEDACDLFAPIAEDRGITFSTSIEPGCEVKGNLPLLQRMLANLIDNAFKYTEREAGVEVSVSNGDGNVKVTVRDEGIGISKDDLKKIFDRFFRGDASRSRQGCGLGLSLVRAVATAHGGRVDVDSAPGSGSRFTVVLPVEMQELLEGTS